MDKWKRIKAEYAAGGISLRELSDKYGVSFSTIQKRSMEEKWGNLRKKSSRYCRSPPLRPAPYRLRPGPAAPPAQDIGVF